MFEPVNEQGVIWVFAQECAKLGICLKEIRSEFPDAIVTKEDVDWSVEFEYAALNFWLHRHNPMKCDVIVCWIDDWPDAPLPVIALSDPDWHEKPWTLPDGRNKEVEVLRLKVDRLERENERLRRRVGKPTENQCEENRNIPGPDELLDIWRRDPHASLRTVADTVGMSKSWVGARRKEMEEAGVIHVNGKVVVK